jgi:uncharacterized protein YybS (DUF2232 family)
MSGAINQVAQGAIDNSIDFLTSAPGEILMALMGLALLLFIYHKIFGLFGSGKKK